jgi:hypothetical protein
MLAYTATGSSISILVNSESQYAVIKNSALSNSQYTRFMIQVSLSPRIKLQNGNVISTSQDLLSTFKLSSPVIFSMNLTSAQVTSPGAIDCQVKFPNSKVEFTDIAVLSCGVTCDTVVEDAVVGCSGIQTVSEEGAAVGSYEYEEEVSSSGVPDDDWVQGSGKSINVMSIEITSDQLPNVKFQLLQNYPRSNFTFTLPAGKWTFSASFISSLSLNLETSLSSFDTASFDPSSQYGGCQISNVLNKWPPTELESATRVQFFLAYYLSQCSLNMNTTLQMLSFGQRAALSAPWSLDIDTQIRLLKNLTDSLSKQFANSSMSLDIYDRVYGFLDAIIDEVYRRQVAAALAFDLSDNSQSNLLKIIAFLSSDSFVTNCSVSRLNAHDLLLRKFFRITAFFTVPSETAGDGLQFGAAIRFDGKDYSLTLPNNYAKVSVPGELIAQGLNKTALDLILFSLQYNARCFNQTIPQMSGKLSSSKGFASPRVSVNVIFPWIGEEALITKLQRYINITLIVSSGVIVKQSEELCCAWFDNSTNTWRTDGCLTTHVSTNEVMCSCNHLTDFALIIHVKEPRQISMCMQSEFDSAGLQKGLKALLYVFVTPYSIALVFAFMYLYAIFAKKDKKVRQHTIWIFSLILTLSLFRLINIALNSELLGMNIPEAIISPLIAIFGLIPITAFFAIAILCVSNWTEVYSLATMTVPAYVIERHRNKFLLTLFGLFLISSVVLAASSIISYTGLMTSYRVILVILSSFALAWAFISVFIAVKLAQKINEGSKLVAKHHNEGSSGKTSQGARKIKFSGIACALSMFFTAVIWMIEAVMLGDVSDSIIGIILTSAVHYFCELLFVGATIWTYLAILQGGLLSGRENAAVDMASPVKNAQPTSSDYKHHGSLL